MRVLVTGSTGFVGTNLVDALERSDHEVTALVRRSSPVERLPDDVATVHGDVCEPSSLDAAFADADAVVHLAAILDDEEGMEKVNVTGTRNVVEAADAHDVETVVFSSTIRAHPELPSTVDSEYLRTKIRAEKAFTETSHTFEYAILYPTYILGPADYRLVRYRPFRRVASNPVLIPPLYTHNRYNVVHVADVVDSIRFCLDGETDGRHVVSGENIGVVAFLREISNAGTGDCRIVPVPFPMTRYAVAPAIDALHALGVSPVEGGAFTSRTDFGTVPPDFENRAPVEQRSWQRAVRDTYEWYESVGML